MRRATRRRADAGGGTARGTMRPMADPQRADPARRPARLAPHGPGHDQAAARRSTTRSWSRCGAATRVLAHLGAGRAARPAHRRLRRRPRAQVADLAALVAGRRGRAGRRSSTRCSRARRRAAAWVSATIAEPRTSLTSMVWKHDPGVEVVRRDANDDPVEGFVALDLLRLEGESLLDLPLLERKRLLESVVTSRIGCASPSMPGHRSTPGSRPGRAPACRAPCSRPPTPATSPAARTFEWRTRDPVASRR